MIERKMHVSPGWMKESITRLKEIESKLTAMKPYIERIRRVNKAWMEHYEQQDKKRV